jgi:hypothetical protein
LTDQKTDLGKDRNIKDSVKGLTIGTGCVFARKQPSGSVIAVAYLKGLLDKLELGCSSQGTGDV